MPSYINDHKYSENEKLFPELNLPHLKTITQRWVKHYQEWGVNFQRITLYRYASSYFGASIKVTYAIVFDISHYEPRPLPGASATFQDCIDDIAECSKLPYDPYSEFIDRDLGVIGGLPEKFDSGDFRVVYNPPRTDEGYKLEWSLIPLFKGAVLSKQVRTDEPFVVLYGLNSEPQSVREGSKTILFSQNDFMHSVPNENMTVHPVLATNSKNNKSNKKDYVSESATVSDNHLGKDISSEQALNNAVSIVSEDINRLYNGMKELLKAKGRTLSNADESQQKEACQKFYDKNSDKFTSLKLNHVEAAIDNSNYWGTNNSARDIKGGLFQQFISHKHSYLFADKNLKTNFQDLYSLSTKLQKQS